VQVGPPPRAIGVPSRGSAGQPFRSGGYRTAFPSRGPQCSRAGGRRRCRVRTTARGSTPTSRTAPRDTARLGSPRRKAWKPRRVPQLPWAPRLDSHPHSCPRATSTVRACPCEATTRTCSQPTQITHTKARRAKKLKIAGGRHEKLTPPP
jgi:hypothetical protein